MPRLLFKLAPVMILLLTVTSLAARSFGSTQPPNPTLQGFTEGCEVKPQPCWYGIVPGATMIDDAKAKLLSNGYSIDSISPLQLSAAKSTDNDCHKTLILFDSHVKQINIMVCETVALGDFVRQFTNRSILFLTLLVSGIVAIFNLFLVKSFRHGRLFHITHLCEKLSCFLPRAASPNCDSLGLISCFSENTVTLWVYDTTVQINFG